jgi:hypothetical protein
MLANWNHLLPEGLWGRVHMWNRSGLCGNDHYVAVGSEPTSIVEWWESPRVEPPRSLMCLQFKLTGTQRSHAANIVTVTVTTTRRHSGW